MTRQQKWATDALGHVLRARDTGANPEQKEKYAAKYRTACMKGPSLVQRVGALQAVAFWMSRPDPAFRDFAKHVAGALAGQDAVQLREQLQKSDLKTYLTGSRDLIEVTLWFRRMAQAELRDPEADTAANPA